MSSHTSGRGKLKSIAWKYFQIKDKESRRAKCNICKNLLSYRSSVTNLLKHLRRKHKNIITDVHEDTSDKSENGEVSNFSLSETDDDDCKDDDSEDSKAVKVLESIEYKNEGEAVCLLCQETFPEQSSDELIEHMLKVHNISQIKIVPGNVPVDQEEDKPVQNTRLRRSKCWDYFTVKDKNLMLAVCKFCDKVLSYKTCVSNLFKHLERKHRIQYNKRQTRYCVNSWEKVNYKPKSAVWSFFDYVNSEKTICACVHCKKEFHVADGLENMKKHLLEKHPEAVLHHKSDGDPLFVTTSSETNMEASDEEDLQVEYLEFDEVDMQEKSDNKPSDQRRSYDDRRSSVDRRPSFNQSSSERGRERKTKRPSIYRSPVRSVAQTKIPESLEHFTNYVTSLLQELPEKVSKRLQMDFVKQIIEAQISCDEMEHTATKTVVNTNSAVGDLSVGESTVNKEMTINKNDDDGTVTISNGIIIRPILSP